MQWRKLKICFGGHIASAPMGSMEAVPLCQTVPSSGSTAGTNVSTGTSMGGFITILVFYFYIPEDLVMTIFKSQNGVAWIEEWQMLQDMLTLLPL